MFKVIRTSDLEKKDPEVITVYSVNECDGFTYFLFFNSFDGWFWDDSYDFAPWSGVEVVK